MIEINLIPDVKLELLRAKKQRASVISLSILVAIVSIGVMVLLAFYTYAVQSVQSSLADGAIKREYETLSKVNDLSKTLTIQSQLGEIESLNNEKHISSRVFDILSTVVPSDKNKVSITNLVLDTNESTIKVEGEASNGYEALEVFKKTIAQTRFQYTSDGTSGEPIAIASNITDGERRYGENSNGERVLRFELTFTYANELFSPSSQNGRVIAPNKQNATDSAKGVPKSLFTNRPVEEGL